MANPSQPASPLEDLNQSHEVVHCETPLQKNLDSEDMLSSTGHTADSSKCKPSSGVTTPDRLTVPKPFKYPERYTSPTDHIISPISKGLLARSRRGGSILPPSVFQSKIHELQPQDARFS